MKTLNSKLASHLALITLMVCSLHANGQAPEINFNQESGFCQNVGPHIAFLWADVENLSSMEWSSNGNGSFDSPNSPVTRYYLTDEDLNSEDLQFTLTGQPSDPAFSEISESMDYIFLWHDWVPNPYLLNFEISCNFDGTETLNASWEHFYPSEITIQECVLFRNGQYLLGPTADTEVELANAEGGFYELFQIVQGNVCFDYQTLTIEECSACQEIPIEWEVNPDCNTETGEYTLTAAPSGGLPALQSGETFTISGAYQNSALQNGESFTIILQVTDGTPIQLIATDAGGCQGIWGIDVSCIKNDIELLTFSASAEAGNNKLYWSTASERGISEFRIDRSKDGEQYHTIGSVTARGGDHLCEYEFLDADHDSQTCYYRLAWLDDDGWKQSSICQVSREHSDSPKIDHFYDRIQLSNVNDRVDWTLSNLTGRIVQSGSGSTIELQALNEGLYLLHFVQNGKKFTHKFLR